MFERAADEALPGIRVWEGDCLTLMGRIPDGSIDAVIADLPYGATSCEWDTIIPFEPLWANYRRVVKANGVVVLTASQPFSSLLTVSNLKWFRHEWIWLKNAGSNFANTGREPMKEHEHVLVFSPGGWTFNHQMQERTGAGLERVQTPVRFETGSDNYRPFERVETKLMPDLRVPSSWQKFNRERGLHPNQKPLALMKYLVLTYTNEGDTVLDNCAGSFTTGVACVQTHRRFIGIEKMPEHVATGRKRLMDLAAVGVLFP